MKLFFAPVSPFARKCRMVAMEKGIELELVEVNPYNDPPELTALNPISKVPTLQVNDVLTLCESPVICEYLDSLSETPKLIPADFNQRILCLNLAALASGASEAAIAIVLENRKPEAARSFALVERKTALIKRTLKHITAQYALEDFLLGEIALACTLSYIDFRLPEFGWQKENPKLCSWFSSLAEWPSFKVTAPH